MTHTVDSQLLPWAIPFIAQWAHEKKLAMVAEMWDIHGLKIVDFYSRFLTWTQLRLRAGSSSSRKQHWMSDIAPFLGWSISNLVAGWLHRTTSSMEKAIVCPYWCSYLFCLCIFFLAYNASAKPQSMDSQNALFIVMAFSTVLLLHSQGSTAVGTWSWNLLVLSGSPPSWYNWPGRKME